MKSMIAITSLSLGGTSQPAASLRRILLLRGGEPRGLGFALRDLGFEALRRQRAGNDRPSAKTSVGVAVIFSFWPSTRVAASGLSQSPLFCGSAPEAKNASQAVTWSGAHQMMRDFLAASGCSWSIGKRKV